MYVLKYMVLVTHWPYVNALEIKGRFIYELLYKFISLLYCTLLYMTFEDKNPVPDIK